MLNGRISAIFMLALMIGVTAWSAYDGGHGVPMMVAASVGVLAATMLLGSLMALLPQTRLSSALFSFTWITLFSPTWEWLAGRFSYPGSIYSALLFGAFFGLIRYLITPGGPSRPPS